VYLEPVFRLLRSLARRGGPGDALGNPSLACQDRETAPCGAHPRHPRGL